MQIKQISEVRIKDKLHLYDSTRQMVAELPANCQYVTNDEIGIVAVTDETTGKEMELRWQPASEVL